MVNNDKYVRTQKRGLNNYLVMIRCINQKKSIKIDDPFEVYALRFIDLYLNKSIDSQEDFKKSSHNLTLMSKMLLSN